MSAKPDAEFYGDSSSKLGLTHSATGGTPSASRSVSGGIEKFFEPQVAEHNRIVRERIDKLSREYQKRGMRPTEARRLAQEELADPERGRDRIDPEDREEEHLRAVAHFADMDKQPPGHSSSGSSSKFKSKKVGTRVCRECHLEICTCASKDCSESASLPYLCETHGVPFSCGCAGRPKKGSRSNLCRTCGVERKLCSCYGGRSAFVGARVSDRTKDALGVDGQPAAGEILECVVAAAVSRGLTVSQMLAALDGLQAPKHAA